MTYPAVAVVVAAAAVVAVVVVAPAPPDATLHAAVSVVVGAAAAAAAVGSGSVRGSPGWRSWCSPGEGAAGGFCKSGFQISSTLFWSCM